MLVEAKHSTNSSRCRSSSTCTRSDREVVKRPPRLARTRSRGEPSLDGVLTSTLKDVQEELSAVKTERRRRQRELLRPARHTPASSPTTTSASISPYLQSHGNVHTISTRSGDASNTIVAAIARNGNQPPYRTTTALPLQLLRVTYVPRPDGRLALCPDHTVGSLVEHLDLSPWGLSAEQTELLARENR